MTTITDADRAAHQRDAESAIDRTDLEWERLNLVAARDLGGDMWSALIRAMARDTRDVPYQYHRVIANLRHVLADVDAMVNERRQA